MASKKNKRKKTPAKPKAKPKVTRPVSSGIYGMHRGMCYGATTVVAAGRQSRAEAQQQVRSLRFERALLKTKYLDGRATKPLIVEEPTLLGKSGDGCCHYPALTYVAGGLTARQKGSAFLTLRGMQAVCTPGLYFRARGDLCGVRKDSYRRLLSTRGTFMIGGKDPHGSAHWAVVDGFRRVVYNGLDAIVIYDDDDLATNDTARAAFKKSMGVVTGVIEVFKVISEMLSRGDVNASKLTFDCGPGPPTFEDSSSSALARLWLSSPPLARHAPRHPLLDGRPLTAHFSITKTHIAASSQI